MKVRSLAVVGVSAALVSVSLAACSSSGPTRSVDAFCTKYKSDKAAYISKFNAEGNSISSAGKSDPLAGLLGAFGMSFQALGSVVDMFNDLDQVAPSEIEPQVAAVRDSLKKEEDQVGGENPTSGGSILTTLLGGLENSLETSGDWTAVGNYVETNCHTN